MPSKMNACFYRAATGCLLLSGVWGLAFAGDLPVATPLERYQPMLDKSPFALATQAATPPPVTDTAGFSKDLILIGISRLRGGQFVSIASRDQSQHFSLSNGDSYNGITVASVDWSDAVGKTKVTLKQGSEYGVVCFDEALLAASASGGRTAGATQTPTPPGNAGKPPLPGVQKPNAPQSYTRPPDAQPIRIVPKRPVIMSAPSGR